MKCLFQWPLLQFAFAACFFLPSPALGVSLKVVRPEPAESISLSSGSTFVVGTVVPAKSTVTCNGVACEVSDDGAFIGFVPIRLGKEWAEVEEKKCDALFEFRASHESDETNVVVWAYTPRSPSAAVLAMTVFDPPRKIRITKNIWIGMEGDRLGDLVYVPRGAMLSTISGNVSNVVCRTSTDVEFSIPVSETIKDDSSLKVTNFQYLEITIHNQKKFSWLPDRPGSEPLLQALPSLLRSRNPMWGFEVASSSVETDQESGIIQPRYNPWERRADMDRGHPFKNLRVCLDPGHHPDQGAVGPRGFEERESNLLLAYETEKLLKAEGVRVSLTREADPLPLRDRHARLQELDPDIVISLHNNSVGDGQDPRLIHGTQTFYLHPWSKPLAEAVHHSILRKLETPDRGCIRRNLYITRFPGCPTILIEPEYIILPDHEKKFMDPTYRQRLAGAIVEGISKFVESQINRDSNNTPAKKD